VFHQAWQGSLGIANNPEKSKIAPNADYLLLPDKHFTWSLPAGLGISTYTDYPKAAQQFIEFMISDEVQLNTYETNGMFPALRSLFQRLGSEGKIDGYETMAEQAKYLIPLPYNTPWYAEFNNEATNALVRTARGEQTADQAIMALAEYQRKLKLEYE
jgi:ABC-type glycerol-3-phosphate transport system substrate-binding protein